MLLTKKPKSKRLIYYGFIEVGTLLTSTLFAFFEVVDGSFSPKEDFWSLKNFYNTIAPPILVSIVLLLIEIRFLLGEFHGVVETVINQSVKPLIIEISGFKDNIARGIVEYKNKIYRSILFIKEKGTLLNAFQDGKSDRRNVLFDNCTINFILSYIKRSLDYNSKVSPLHDLGKKSGQLFVDELNKYIERMSSDHKKQKDLPSYITYWMKFDSDAGFGKFTFDGFTDDESDFDPPEKRSDWLKDMRIFLHYPFFSENLQDREQFLCDFMRGYIEGVLNKFPRKILAQALEHNPQINASLAGDDWHIHVRHNADMNHCVCAGREPADGCIFNIEVSFDGQKKTTPSSDSDEQIQTDQETKSIITTALPERMD